MPESTLCVISLSISEAGTRISHDVDAAHGPGPPATARSLARTSYSAAKASTCLTSVAAVAAYDDASQLIESRGGLARGPMAREHRLKLLNHYLQPSPSSSPAYELPVIALLKLLKEHRSPWPVYDG